nr:60S ribosomal protein L23 [Tanacetum cinerariifolium]
MLPSCNGTDATNTQKHHEQTHINLHDYNSHDESQHKQSLNNYTFLDTFGEPSRRDNLSPPASPPFSPAMSGAGFSPISRFADRLARADTLGLTHLGNNDYVHQDTMNEYINNQSLNELMRSMEAMNIEDNNNEYMNMNSRWIDSGINGGEYPQFDLSPTQCGSDMGRTFARTNDPRMNNVYGETSVNNGPDLGWNVMLVVVVRQRKPLRRKDGVFMYFEDAEDFKFVPIAMLTEADLRHMSWLRACQDLEVCMVGDEDLTQDR